MKAVKALAKTFTLGVGLVSLVAVAETYYDKQFYTANFMDEVEEVRLTLPTKPEKRIVASQEKNLPIVQEVTLDNSSLIDGEWKITKVIDDRGEVTYDIEADRSNQPVVVDMKLISVGTVRIDEDIEQTFRVSYLTENGTIALFKEFGEGYEIVQAVKYNRPKVQISKAPVFKAEPTQQEEQVVKTNKYHIEEALVLVSAIDPKQKGAIRGNFVQGRAYLNNGELILEGVAIHMSTQNQTEQVSTEIRLKGHGAFNDDNGIAGVVTNVSKDEVKVRFSTGPLAGAMLNFVTEEKRMKIEEKFGATNRDNVFQEENQYETQAVAPQAEVQQVNTQETVQSEEGYYEEEYYEEVDGERFNDSQLPEFQDAAEFENENLEAEQTRYPSSIKEAGFSF